MNELNTGIIALMSSSINMTLFNGLFVAKSNAMAGQVLPPLTHFYRGYGENISCDGVNWVIGVLANKCFKEVLFQSKPLTNAQECLGGLFSGAISGPIIGSLERLMIVSHLRKENEYKGRGVAITLQIAKKIFREESFKGLFKGGLITQFRESINFACYYGLQKILQAHQVPQKGKNREFLIHITYLEAGCVSGFLTTPIDRAKTIFQSKFGTESISQVFLEIYKGNKPSSPSLKNFFVGGSWRVLTIGCTMTGFAFITQKISKVFE